MYHIKCLRLAGSINKWQFIMSVKGALFKTLQMTDLALCPFICSLMFGK